MENQSFDDLPRNILQIKDKLDKIEELLLEIIAKQTNEKEYEEEILTVKGAANYLDLSVPTIYSKVSRGEIPHMKRGKRIYFSRSELKGYVREGR